MSFSDSDPPPQPPYMQPNYAYGGDMGGMGGFWPQTNEKIEPHSQFEYEEPPSQKRPRNWGNNQPIPNSAPLPMNPRPNPMNPPTVNKGTGRIFYKTRMCLKFKDGMCRNGDSCNFAHGNEDLREPPPNWQELVSVREKDKGIGNGGWNDDQRIQQKKLCRKFYNGEECPYGEKCNFLHEGPPKFNGEPDWIRESSVISIGTTGHGMMGHRSEPVQIDVLNKQLSETSSGFGFDSKPVFRKTKMCTKWETTGYCPFGERCHFAHGPSDLRGPGSIEAGAANVTATSTNPVSVPAYNEAPHSILVAPPPDDEVGKKIYAKLKGAKKLDKIYADWLDGMTPPRTMPEEGQ